jgi:hypothetical protein
MICTVGSKILIAVRVIEMEVGVDDCGDRLVGERLHFFEQDPGRGRRDVIVHDESRRCR